jgi:hypothetical protein|tara:strand:- start:332 stop:493 length:162 start_codon:yes stop_codon:yes gene_type:complete
MIYDILLWLAGFFVGFVGFRVLLLSSEMLSERKANYRAGTHDYYGNKIHEDDR